MRHESCSYFFLKNYTQEKRKNMFGDTSESEQFFILFKTLG